MGENLFDNPINAHLPAYESSNSQFASRYAEVASILEQLVARIEQTSRDIESVLATTAA